MQREAQRQAQVDPVPARSAAALIHASNAYLTMGKTDEALKLSQERLETFRRNRDFESEIVAQSSIVSVYVNSGRLRQAADVAEETLRKVQSRPSSRLLKCWEIDLLQTLAKIYLRAEDVENAEKIVDQTIAVASEQKDLSGSRDSAHETFEPTLQPCRTGSPWLQLTCFSPSWPCSKRNTVLD